MDRARLSDAEILAQIPRARALDEAERAAGLRAKSAKYDRAKRRVVMELTNGYSFAFPVRALPELRKATPKQLEALEVDPSGGVIGWEALDVHLSVPGLLLAAVGDEEGRRHLARLAGRVSSKAKAAAARRNGAKGGRPRKTVQRRNVDQFLREADRLRKRIGVSTTAEEIVSARHGGGRRGGRQV